MAFAAQSARSAGLKADAVSHVQLAVDEACANVVEHAYTGWSPATWKLYAVWMVPTLLSESGIGAIASI